MSLYIGDALDYPLLHVTSSHVAMADIITTDNLPTTGFNSSNSFMHVEYHSTLSEYTTVYTSHAEGHRGVALLFQLTSEQQTVLLSSSVVAFGKSAYGTTTTMRGSFTWHKQSVVSPSECKEGFKLFVDASGELLGVGLYLGVEGTDYSAPTSIPYLDIYTTAISTPTGGSIQIGGGSIVIGTTDLATMSFLNLGAVNTIDTAYADMDGLTIQILNSKKGLSTSSIVVTDTAISVQYGDSVYPILGGGLLNTTMLTHSDVGTDVTSCPIPTTAALCVITITNSRFSTMPATLVFNTTVSFGFMTYYYYTGPSELLEITTELWAEYDSTSGALRIVNKGGLSDPNKYIDEEFSYTLSTYAASK